MHFGLQPLDSKKASGTGRDTRAMPRACGLFLNECLVVSVL